MYDFGGEFKDPLTHKEQFMSLEDDLKENTAAKKENTAALIALTEVMVKHNELLGGLAARTGGAPAATSMAANATATTTAPPKETAAQKKAREKAEADTKAAETKAAEQAAKDKPAEVTVDSVREAVSAWLVKSAKGSAESEAKRAEMKKLLAFFGIERVNELPADKASTFLDMFEQIKNGEDPYPADDSAGAGEDDPLL